MGRILVMHAITLFLNVGIIVYENVVADTYHTLVNKVVSIMAAYNVTFGIRCVVGRTRQNNKKVMGFVSALELSWLCAT